MWRHLGRLRLRAGVCQAFRGSKQVRLGGTEVEHGTRLDHGRGTRM